MPSLPPLLAAVWRRPLLLSWPIAGAALRAWLPAGLVLDCWQGCAYISLVGICFEDTRILGLPAWARRYAEVNLRFYVRRRVSDSRRGAPGDRCPAPGVVFIRQIVPHRITAVAARCLYGEPFVRRPVRCDTDASGVLAYRWGGAGGGRWHTFQAQIPAGAGADSDTYADAYDDARVGGAVPGSLDEFLTARYWGYNGKPDGPTRAYQLTRDPWRLRRVPVADVSIDADLTAEYGPVLGSAMSVPPVSALLASDGRARIRLPRRL